jgi:MFS family permease
MPFLKAQNANVYSHYLRHGNPLIYFDPVEELRVVRKIDMYIVPWAAILYLFCFIDRANIGWCPLYDPKHNLIKHVLINSKGNALLAGLETDLGLHGYDYNTVLSIFYISYIVFEIPANMACKWIGPGWFLPGTTLGFGIATVSFAFVRDIGSACGVRFILGIFEAGMLPGLAYYMSRWYRRSELAFRLSLYVVMAPLAGAFGGLLASGILMLPSFGSTHRWQMIFAIEGIITIGLALIAFATMTDRPETARWLNQREKDLANARLKSERIGTTEVLDNFHTKKLLRGIFNPVTLVTGWIFLLLCITVQAFAFFAPTIIRTIYPEATVIRQQLMTVPPYVVGAFFMLSSNFLSSKFDRRNIVIGVSPVPVIAGYIAFLATSNSQVRYGATFLIVAGAFNAGSLCNAQVSANVVSDTARSAAIGTNVMLGNVGGLIATWAFLPFDGPNYPIGNGLNLAAQVLVLLSALCLGFWMRYDNKRRAKRDVISELRGLDTAEIENMDWWHPGFIWRP